MSRAPAIAVLAALALLACGESRQEKFEKAMHEAEVAREALDAARGELASREVAYEAEREEAREAEEALEIARRKLDAASASYDGARAEVAKWADDASVSRVLQQALLDESALAHAAIAARVEHGVALLEGTAPDDAARERALEIAREIPGVAEVQSRIEVVAPAPPEPPTAEPSPTVPELPIPAPIEPPPSAETP
jgi:osmotically-inducible protein OsmY